MSWLGCAEMYRLASNESCKACDMSSKWLLLFIFRYERLSELMKRLRQISAVIFTAAALVFSVPQVAFADGGKTPQKVANETLAAGRAHSNVGFNDVSTRLPSGSGNVTLATATTATKGNISYTTSGVGYMNLPYDKLPIEVSGSMIVDFRAIEASSSTCSKALGLYGIAHSALWGAAVGGVPGVAVGAAYGLFWWGVTNYLC